MVGIMDAVPAGREVAFRGGKINVRGVGARGISRLFTRFPDLANVMQGKAVDVGDLLGMGGDAVAAIIAEGCSQPGDEAFEAAVDNLTFDEITDLLEAVLAQTMPGGVVPFAERFSRLGAVLNPSAPAGKASALKSPKPSRTS